MIRTKLRRGGRTRDRASGVAARRVRVEKARGASEAAANSLTLGTTVAVLIVDSMIKRR